MTNFPTFGLWLIYDGWNMITETINTAAPRHYLWGLDLSGTAQGAGGVGGLLGFSFGTNWFIPLYDANGNIPGYVSANTGKLTKLFEYDANGNITYHNGSINIFRYRFSTKYFDTETGLYYYGYRFYSPSLRRWLNRDPIEEQGGLNLYAFCGNDAVNAVDMFGLWKEPDKEDFYGNYLKEFYQKSRRVYKYEQGDTLDGLAEKVKLGRDDIAGWARFNPGHSREVTEMLVSSGTWRKFCYVSVPNVWIDADLLRGGGLYSRIVNIGGTIGSFIGTDVLVSRSRNVIKVETVAGLIAALNSNVGNIFGMTVYGHGSDAGDLSESVWNSRGQDKSWMWQTDLLPLVGQNGYKLFQINMMQCYSGAVVPDPSNRHGGSSSVDFRMEWNKLTNDFNGYDGVNVLGFDDTTGWKIFPWNW